VDRLACINVSSFPLQLLLKRHWEWKNLPVAVVTKESPQGIITSVNQRAEACGVTPGMRYATGLAMTLELRAGAISRWEIDAAVEKLTRCLQRFSPKVEPSREEPGIFWLGACGLSYLYSTVGRWAQRILQALGRESFDAKIAVGFTKFGSYAAAKTVKHFQIFSSPETERKAAFQSALSVLPLKPVFYERLEKLGLKNVGSFLSLSAEAIRKRFGEDVERIHRFASGNLVLPLQPIELYEERDVSKSLLVPEIDSARLLFHLEECLYLLLSDAESRQELVAQLRLILTMEGGKHHSETIRPAAPTLDRAVLLELFKIRFGALQLSSGIVSLNLSASCVKAENIQLELFKKKPKRDLDRGARAFARIRAVLGNDAVQKARLENDYLPEKCYSWQTIERPSVSMKQNQEPNPMCLVRRVLRQPALFDQESKRVIRLSGPYVISGRWWEEDFKREYYFAETEKGALLWLFYDRRNRCWMISGLVE
jgi:protein ImuB